MILRSHDYSIGSEQYLHGSITHPQSPLWLPLKATSAGLVAVLRVLFRSQFCQPITRCHSVSIISKVGVKFGSNRVSVKLWLLSNCFFSDLSSSSTKRNKL